MKKWLMAVLAGVWLLGGVALADEQIVLSPDNTTATDSTVTIDGQTVTITQEGTYHVSGELTDGMLRVEAPQTAKVTLVLDGVTIRNSEEAALYVQQADKVVIELTQGTVNVLQSGVETAEDAAAENDADILDDANVSDDASGGALHSRDDLTIKGDGALQVLGYVNNGIHCTADVKIKGGSITVTAVNHGIKGKKSVTVSGGSLVITSGKDGITSDELEREDKGFVTVEGGEIIINSDGDGIAAETTLTVSGGMISVVSGGGSASAQNSSRDSWWDFDFFSTGNDDEEAVSCKGLKAGKALVISGGSLTVDAYDDALHTDGDMTISGGECVLSSGDDGAHADVSLTMLDGSVTVLTSYEGFEANQITLAGGNLDITATDDGVNANGGADAFGFGGFGGGGRGMGGFGGGFGKQDKRQEDRENAPQSDATAATDAPDMATQPEMPTLPEGMTPPDGMSMPDGATLPENMTPPDGMSMPDGATMPENMTPPDGMSMPDGAMMPENMTPPDGMPEQANSTEEEADATSTLPLLLITGGRITVTADGDGLDTNGDLRVEGGEIVVNGPANSANGALDIGTENGGTAFISGGTIIALGASGMAETFGDTSTQCSFLVTMKTFTGQSAITITDSQGNILYQGETCKSGNSVVFSSPALKVGETYTVTIGKQSVTVEQTETVVGSGFSFGFGGGFGGGRGW